MTAIPRLLELLNIKESIITIDAIGTTQQIMGAIENGEGHFVLTVKRSNPLTYEELGNLFDMLEDEKKKLDRNPKYQSVFEEYLQTYDSCKKNHLHEIVSLISFVNDSSYEHYKQNS